MDAQIKQRVGTGERDCVSSGGAGDQKGRRAHDAGPMCANDSLVDARMKPEVVRIEDDRTVRAVMRWGHGRILLARS